MVNHRGNQILDVFNAYFGVAFELSQSMVDETADFSTIGEVSQRMTDSLTKTDKLLKAFRDQNYESFKGAIFKNGNNENIAPSQLQISSCRTIILTRQSPQ